MLKKRRTGKLIIVLSAIAGLIYMLPLTSLLSSPLIGGFFSEIISEGGVARERDLSYGLRARQKLDIYRPANDQAAGPIILFFYGGGWRSGDRSLYGFLGTAFARQGYTTIIADYRLYPEVKFPDFVEDAALAYQWTHRQIAAPAKNQHHKTRPIILMGHSAGAHIAALLAMDRHYLAAIDASLPQPAGLIGLAGPMSFDPTTDPTTKDIFATVAEADTARPVHFARKRLPPTLLIHGLNDTRVRPWNSRQLAQSLTKVGADVCAIELPGIGHIGLILSISKPLRWRAPVLDQSIKFIENINKESKTGSSLSC